MLACFAAAGEEGRMVASTCTDPANTLSEISVGAMPATSAIATLKAVALKSSGEPATVNDCSMTVSAEAACSTPFLGSQSPLPPKT